MHNDVLEEFSGITFSKNGIQTAAWDRLLDSDLGNPCQEKGCKTLKKVEVAFEHMKLFATRANVSMFCGYLLTVPNFICYRRGLLP
jgi:hypothetical protein